MDFLDDPAASQIARERTIFPNPLSQTYSERSNVTTLSPCFVFTYCLSQLLNMLLASAAFLHTFHDIFLPTIINMFACQLLKKLAFGKIDV